MTFAYNADGALTTLTRPNGVTSTNTYDDAGRLTGLTYKNSAGTTIAAYTYTLDAAGNRTSATTAGSGTEHYTLVPGAGTQLRGRSLAVLVRSSVPRQSRREVA